MSKTILNHANYRPAKNDGDNCNNCKHQGMGKSKVYNGYIPCTIDCWRKKSNTKYDWYYGQKGVCDRWEK